MDLIYFTLYCFIAIGVIYCINEFYQIRRKLEDNARQIKQHQKLLFELQKYIEHTKISEQIKNTQELPETYTSNQINTVKTLEDLPAMPNWFDGLCLWFKNDWLLKLGALFMILGFAWFASYSILNGWLSPLQKVVLGFISGFGIGGFGCYRIRKYLLQGGVFIVLGSAIVFIMIYVARNIYSLLDPLVALSIMFLVSTLIAYISARYKTKSLALLSLILAGIAPMIVNSIAHNYYGLYTYLFVVSLGAVCIAFIIKCKELILTSLIIILCYVFYLYGNLSSDVVVCFTNLFGLMYLIANVLSVKLISTQKRIDSIVAVGNCIFLLLWFLGGLDRTLGSRFLFIWAVIFAGVAIYFWYKHKNSHYFYIYSAIASLTLFTATTWLLYNSNLLNITLANETLLVTYSIYRISLNITIAKRFSWLILLSSLMVVNNIESSSWQNGTWHFDALTIAVVAVVLLAMSRLLYVNKPAHKQMITPYVYLLLGSLYLYTLLWLVVNVLFVKSVIAISVLFTCYIIIGVILYFKGIRQGNKLLQYYGSLLIGFVTLRLLLVDIWQMVLLGRIITVFLIGVVLISTAFYSKKNNVARQSKYI